MLHNAFLVHDDIEDASLLRRGQPTLHVAHGVPLAINAGDALAVLAHAPLRDNRDRLGSRLATLVAEEFDLMERRTLEGQAMELGWRRDGRLDLTPEHYLDLVLRKTCWYTTIHPLRVGALIGSWAKANLDPLVVFGSYLGAAFQIADDLLNLDVRADRYGKEPFGDLREGKRTLMVIHLLGTVGPADRRFVIDFFAEDGPPRSAAAAQSIFELMVAHGSVEFARRFGQGIADAARTCFDEAFSGLPDSGRAPVSLGYHRLDAEPGPVVIDNAAGSFARGSGSRDVRTPNGGRQMTEGAERAGRRGNSFVRSLTTGPRWPTTW